jgi:ATP-dependent DNA helicase 2 subunit 2
MRVILTLLVLAGMALAKERTIKVTEKDMMRKSIVYDKNTPDVFYCPTSKPHGFDKLIVKFVLLFLVV